MDRVEKRALPLEIYEKREFQKRVRQRYLEVITDYERSESEMRVIRIDAARPIDEIAEKIWSIARNLPKMGT
jgi:dTMP kinase